MITGQIKSQIDQIWETLWYFYDFVLSLQNEFAAKIEAIEGQKKLIESSIAAYGTLCGGWRI